MFPRVSRIEDLWPFVEADQRIRSQRDDATGQTVICYMLQNEDTFEGDHPALTRECRGIAFDAEGFVSCRPLHKFFNVGERPTTLPNALPWAEATRVMEKRDGSMVSPARLAGGGFQFKTKKSFATPEAAFAEKLARATPGGVGWLDAIIAAGLTPIFEITSPRFPIVVRYGEDAVTLLHIRKMESGRYLTEAEIHGLAPPFPVAENLLPKFSVGGIASWEKFAAAAETVKGLEGWVIQFGDGEMVKLKTSWYVGLHQSVTFSRWRDLARSVVADQADDLKAAFSMVGRSVEPIHEVERRIAERIAQARSEVTCIAASAQSNGLSAKDLAGSHKSHPSFALVMRAYRNQEIDWLEWYGRSHLELDWGLEVVPG